MIGSSPAFEAYVDRARDGKLGLWRFGSGLVLIVVASIVAFIAIFVVWSIALTVPIVMETGAAPSEAAIQTAVESMLDGHTPAAATSLLLAWAGMWLGVWLALRLLQRRRVATVIAARAGLFWPDFLRAAAATAIGGVLVTLISLFFGSEFISRGALDFERWLWWLVPLSLATLVQTSAEEVVFRGYITQTLAARFQSSLIWAVIPIAAFCAVHFSSAFSQPTNFTVVAFAAVFGTLATVLVSRTGSLGASMGMHFLNNLIGFAFIGSEDFFGGGALFVSSPLSSLGWSQALFGFATSVLPLGIAMLLLFEPRSPLRLRSLDSFSSPSSAASLGE